MWRASGAAATNSLWTDPVIESTTCLRWHGYGAVSLIGFIMALGIVVDDAIVVGEESLTQFDAGTRSPAVRVTLAPAAEAAEGRAV